MPKGKAFGARHRDKNEPECIQGLLDGGAEEVIKVESTRPGVPDLIVKVGGTWHWFEVKRDEWERRCNKHQLQFMCENHVFIVRREIEAYRFVRNLISIAARSDPEDGATYVDRMGQTARLTGDEVFGSEIDQSVPLVGRVRRIDD